VENPEYLLLGFIGGKFALLNVQKIVEGIASDLGGDVAVECGLGGREGVSISNLDAMTLDERQFSRT
jgi:hypothetical protein